MMCQKTISVLSGPLASGSAARAQASGLRARDSGFQQISSLEHPGAKCLGAIRTLIHHWAPLIFLQPCHRTERPQNRTGGVHPHAMSLLPRG